MTSGGGNPSSPGLVWREYELMEGKNEAWAERQNGAENEEGMGMKEGRAVRRQLRANEDHLKSVFELRRRKRER